MATLQVGSRGQAVTDLQNALNSVGYPVAVDGVFGSKTQRAVMSFQQDHELTVNGVADAETQDLITQLMGAASSTAVYDDEDGEVITAGGGSSSAPVLITSGPPKWLLPVGLGAIGLVGLALMMQDNKKRRR
jgi:peptidoglycan hydrolase-like protein with peptidoglycan-binding domain